MANLLPGRGPEQAKQALNNKLRRFLLTEEHPDYVAEQLKRRRGECTQCGRCCRILFDCPNLGTDNRCTIYETRSASCRAFPIDETDLAEVDYKCGYTFVTPLAGPRPGKQLGLVRIPIESGPWNIPDYPDAIELNDRVYLKVVGLHIPHPGVVAQYREAYARDSRHLYVLSCGSYVIDHIDSYNPDAGLLDAAAHLAIDVATPGTYIVIGGGLVLTWLFLIMTGLVE